MLVAAGTGLLGTLPGWLTFAGVVAAAFIFYRGGGGTAIQSLQVANQVLEKRIHDLEMQGRKDTATIAELRGRTDVAAALQPMVEWTVHHETRAQERHAGTLTVLNLIASRLGPDPNVDGD